MQIDPTWIITTYDDETQRAVEFSQLFALRSKIRTALLLWDTNSYYVNVKDRFFMINGGRKIPINDNFSDTISFLYARRNKQSVALFTSKGSITKPEVSYILGVEGIENQELFIHITKNGTLWEWGDKR